MADGMEGVVDDPTSHLSVRNGRDLYLFMNSGFTRSGSRGNNIVMIMEPSKSH